MTDEQIIKYLKELLEVMLNNGDLQGASTVSHAIDLIKRQQTEIEDLTERLKEYKSFPCFTNDTQVVTVSKKADGQYCADRVTTIQIDKIRAEAYKEFAERLKKNFETYTDDEEQNALYVRDLIDNLVKELTEESK